VLFVSQEERRASETVLFTSENNDIANQSVDTSFFTDEKYRMTNQLASLARRHYVYRDAFQRVNLGMYVINSILSCHAALHNENELEARPCRADMRQTSTGSLTV